MAINPSNMVETEHKARWDNAKPTAWVFRGKVAGTALSIFAVIALGAGFTTLATLRLRQKFFAVFGSVVTSLALGGTITIFVIKVDYNRYHSERAVKKLCRKLETISLKDLYDMSKAVDNFFKYGVLGQEVRNPVMGALGEYKRELTEQNREYNRHYNRQDSYDRDLRRDSFYGGGYSRNINVAKKIVAEDHSHTAAISQIQGRINAASSRWNTTRTETVAHSLPFRSHINMM